MWFWCLWMLLWPGVEEPQAVLLRWVQYAQGEEWEKLQEEVRGDRHRALEVGELLLERFDRSIHSWRDRPESRRVRYSEQLLETGLRVSRLVEGEGWGRRLAVRFQARQKRVRATELLNGKEYRAALETVLEARRLGEEAGDEDFIFSTYLTSAYAHLEMGEARKALEDCRQALKVAEGLTAPEKLALALYNLGAAHLHLGRYRDSIPFSQRAVEETRRLGRKIWEANSRLNLGSAYLLSGELEAAREEFEQALALSRQAADPLGEGRALYNLGLLYYTDREWSPAYRYLEASLPLVREVDIRHSHEIDDYNYVERDVLERLLECHRRLALGETPRVRAWQERLAELKEKERESGRGHHH